MEVIDLVNELCYIFSLLYSFISSDANICSTMAFLPLGKSNHVVSVSIDFPTSSKWDDLFHCIVFDYSCANWNGLWEMCHGRISLNTLLLLVVVNFVSGLRLIYIFLIESIRSNLTHLYGFQLSVQLP